MNVKILSLILSVAMLIFIIELSRREKLTFKYAAGWIIASLAAIFFTIFNRLLFKLAAWFGFKLPSNFIFFVCFFAFVILTLLLTLFLCQQNKRNDLIAQKRANMDEFINLAVARLVEFHKTLSTEQREKLVAKLEWFHNKHQHNWE